MPTYPSLPTEKGDIERPLDDIQVDRATNGDARARAFYPAIKRTFTLVHPGLSSAQLETLVTFYNANRGLVFDYVSVLDGATYSCLFAGAWKPTRKSGPYTTVVVTLEQV